MLRKKISALAIGVIIITPISDGYADVCKVPMSIINIGTPTKPKYKVGINVGLGGGAPRLYEFDTGGSGFWAAYNHTLSQSSQWWGSASLISQDSLSIRYTSGNEYTANLVSTTVSLFDPSAQEPSTPLCSTPGPVQISQITQYANVYPTKQDSVALWNKALSSGSAPLFGYFWGNFGAALHPAADSTGSAGVYTILNQFQTGTYHNGFIVHLGNFARPNKQAPYVQIGLSKKDIDSFPYQMPMNLDCPEKGPFLTACPLPKTFSNTPVSPYAEAQFTADVSIHGKKHHQPQVLSRIGVTIDSGAPIATIWQTADYAVSKSFLKRPKRVPNIQSTLYSGTLKNGYSVNIDGTTNAGSHFSAMLKKTNSPVFSKVMANYHLKSAPNSGFAYINTGILFYSEWDVMYDVSAGVIGFRPAQR